MNKKHLIVLGAVAVLLIAYFGTKMYVTREAEAKVKEVITRISPYANIHYQNVGVDLPGLDIRISDVGILPSGTTEKVKINEIVVGNLDLKNDMPAFMTVSLNGVELDPKTLKKEAKQLNELGYKDKIFLDVKIDYKYDQERRDLNITHFSMGAKNVGEMNVRLHLGNIDLNPDQLIGLLFTYPQVLLYEAGILYKDDSLSERLLERQARTMNQSKQDVQEGLIRSVEGEMAKTHDQMAKNAWAEVIKFIKNPEAFSVSASPSQPQPLGKIIRTREFTDFVKLLNLDISS